MITFDRDGLGNWKKKARHHMERREEFFLNGWKYGDWDEGFLEALANEFGYELSPQYPEGAKLFPSKDSN